MKKIVKWLIAIAALVGTAIITDTVSIPFDHLKNALKQEPTLGGEVSVEAPGNFPYTLTLTRAATGTSLQIEDLRGK